ncbi:MAG: hypothetical protein Q7T50_04690 [Candidatus Magasanikbacteria bacterium]|nr:hypothetical protein [Candidatus Magasanikbacteria bacterium]
MKRLILKEIFYCLSASLVVFSCLELVFPNIILAYLNLDLVLILWVIVGIMVVRVDNK